MCDDLNRIAEESAKKKEAEAGAADAVVHMVCRMLGTVNGRTDHALASPLVWKDGKLALN